MEVASEAVVFDDTKHCSLLPAIAAVHMACITTDGTIATFLPPLSQEKITLWWEDHSKDSERKIILHLATEPSTGKFAVAGVVMLVNEGSKNEGGRFRGGVSKLLVSPSYRRRGIAKQLMGKLEKEAREWGLTLLVGTLLELLDTEVGSPAEKVYPRLGWIKVGVIPKFEQSPADGELKDNVFFYKNLLLDV
ncbi:hypothetical protein BP5796_11954 [Coleophoma crateriformis]|uniref:N-acetyltransferase domain-containing protein n=1 Tax=Coleophoma crateriformis TaxID=565419 RepID=A0A3D8QBK3_9HELO|nr:hypothetical protein BP5796_11954 [Coleophoma crateriformis]